MTTITSAVSPTQTIGASLHANPAVDAAIKAIRAEV
ncbi:MAG: hypothetical protein RIR10_1818, partial [Planctomycetota bacterium]